MQDESYTPFATFSFDGVLGLALDSMAQAPSGCTRKISGHHKSPQAVSRLRHVTTLCLRRLCCSIRSLNALDCRQSNEFSVMSRLHGAGVLKPEP